jgi:hypothetical protein
MVKYREVLIGFREPFKVAGGKAVARASSKREFSLPSKLHSGSVGNS